MTTGDVYYTTAQYLMQNGYSRAAAAGIAGDIAGESGGNPESVGDNGNAEGLIQWNPYTKATPNYPIVTGDVQKDFNAQLPDIVAYNNQQGAAYVRQLNQQTDPVAAAQYYSLNFERPAQQYSDVNPDVAMSVYNELGGQATGTNPQTANTTSSLTSNPLSLSSFLGIPNFSDLMQRLGLILLGSALILIGVYMLAGKQILQVGMKSTPLGEVLSHSGRVARAGRQDRAARRENTGDMDERRLSLRERRVTLAEQVEARKAAREAGI